jgi:UDP-N-acetylglucosamine 2-epimerase (non-hydrolysing)
MVVFGTRPEAIKMCPLVMELRRRSDVFDTVVCVTGQHREMLRQVLEVFHVYPEYDLDIMKKDQTLFDVTTEALDGMKSVLEKEKPDIVLVHGDTTTAFAAGLASFYLHIPVGHVEAGLRTYRLEAPFPEEFNRQAIDVYSDFYFAPTETAKQNLINEHKDPGSIYVTGNTVIDALSVTVDRNYTHPVLDWVGGSRMVLVTAHRRENIGAPMEHIFSAIKRLAEKHEDVRFVYPIHKNPAVREIADRILTGCGRVKLIEPLDVFDFHNFMSRAYIIMTDSGGIQEEAPALGIPVLVLRDTTERPEGIAAGTLKLTGTDEENIFRETERLLTDRDEYEKMSRASNPYGDGTASRRIADVLEKEL